MKSSTLGIMIQHILFCKEQDIKNLKIKLHTIKQAGMHPLHCLA